MPPIMTINSRITIACEDRAIRVFRDGELRYETDSGFVFLVARRSKWSFW